MGLRHACHLVAETLNHAGAALLGEDGGTIQARVLALGEESGAVLLRVERREYELTVRERNRRPVTPNPHVADEEANCE